ncbi:polyprenyl synthetase family protein [Pseudoramibacter faecis]|uniref:polyprenyl synthetase family protein n=1 Tax=Pseudoramibacter faecis TaxID=3108534 RepID=UPI002E77691A|nr:polyprenyl synthetase family protein [Pseudoramibacter sp. HA2172]
MTGQTNAAAKLVVFDVTGDRWQKEVKTAIARMTAHDFAGTPVGFVLDDTLSDFGKMLRPRLLLLCASLGPAWHAHRREAVELAAMVELIHLASLIHDDIVDDARFRRGKPAIQSRYGKDAAVYAGDFIMARVNYYQLKDGLNAPGAVLAEAIEKMCAGEIGQACLRHRPDATQAMYFENIKGKTGALFAAACRIGAMTGGCAPEAIERLARFGELLGILFQLRDDLLDFTAAPLEDGKDVCQDVREGIYTLPLLIALADDKAGAALRPLLAANREAPLDFEGIVAVRGAIDSCGGLEQTRQAIRTYRDQATAILDDFPSSHSLKRIKRFLARLEV